jgi:hypothetical protein
MINVKLDVQHLIQSYNAKFHQNLSSSLEDYTCICEQVGGRTHTTFLLCVHFTHFVKKKRHTIHPGTSVRGAAIGNDDIMAPKEVAGYTCTCCPTHTCKCMRQPLPKDLRLLRR